MLAKAVAGEAGVPLLCLHAAAIENKWFGESAKLLASAVPGGEGAARAVRRLLRRDRLAGKGEERAGPGVRVLPQVRAAAVTWTGREQTFPVL